MRCSAKIGKKYGVARSNDSRKDYRRSFGVGIVVLAMGVVLIVGVSLGGLGADNPDASSAELCNELEILLECPGWTDDNVELGVFVSGDSLNEQVLFSGSGSHAMQVGAGRYELVPQMPQLMVADGTVLEANEPASFYFEATSEKTNTASIIYEVADSSVFSEDELAFISETSFTTEDAAHQAFAQSRKRASL